jgi:hypothetical protein
MNGSNLSGINYERFPLLKGNKFMQEMHRRREFGLPNLAWGNINELDNEALKELGHYGAMQERYERYPHYSSPASGVNSEERRAYYDAIAEEKRAIQRQALKNYQRRYPGKSLRDFLALERKIEAEHANIRKSRRREKRAAKQRAKTVKRKSPSSSGSRRRSRS